MVTSQTLFKLFLSLPWSIFAGQAKSLEATLSFNSLLESKVSMLTLHILLTIFYLPEHSNPLSLLFAPCFLFLIALTLLIYLPPLSRLIGYHLHFAPACAHAFQAECGSGTNAQTGMTHTFPAAKTHTRAASFSRLTSGWLGANTSPAFNHLRCHRKLMRGPIRRRPSFIPWPVTSV